MRTKQLGRTNARAPHAPGVRIPSDDHNATTSRARREQWPRRTGPRRAKFVANRAYGIADAGEGGRCARVINTHIYIYI